MIPGVGHTVVVRPQNCRIALRGRPVDGGNHRRIGVVRIGLPASIVGDVTDRRRIVAEQGGGHTPRCDLAGGDDHRGLDEASAHVNLGTVELDDPN